MSELADRQCVPCRGGVPPLDAAQIAPLLGQLEPGWQVIGGHHLQRRYRLKNFREALALANRIGELAEQQRHHPELRLGWGYLEVAIWTHKVDGLTESDFVLAAKCDRLVRELGGG
ncbi:MAG: putative pterin-4-alpha-carbinolamine dehydratase [Planctomycetota bacterium]|nr:MAG: putative pterin-4-alpha-carbinolamine dehydratase [Planctomycetota bacterium]